MELDQTHYFALASYLAEGYSRDAENAKVDYAPDFADYIINREVGEVDSVAFTEYLGVHSPITQEVEDRITIIYGEDTVSATTTDGAYALHTGSFVSLLSLAYCIYRASN